MSIDIPRPRSKSVLGNKTKSIMLQNKTKWSVLDIVIKREEERIKKRTQVKMDSYTYESPFINESPGLSRPKRKTVRKKSDRALWLQKFLAAGIIVES